MLLPGPPGAPSLSSFSLPSAPCPPNERMLIASKVPLGRALAAMVRETDASFGKEAARLTARPGRRRPALGAVAALAFQKNRRAEAVRVLPRGGRDVDHDRHVGRNHEIVGRPSLSRSRVDAARAFRGEEQRGLPLIARRRGKHTGSFARDRARNGGSVGRRRGREQEERQRADTCGEPRQGAACDLLPDHPLASARNNSR